MVRPRRKTWLRLMVVVLAGTCIPAAAPRHVAGQVDPSRGVRAAQEEEIQRLNREMAELVRQKRYQEAEALRKRLRALMEEQLESVKQQRGQDPTVRQQTERLRRGEPLVLDFPAALFQRPVPLGAQRAEVRLESQDIRAATEELMSLETTLGVDHPDVTEAINDLGVMYDARGRFGPRESALRAGCGDL